MRLTRMQLRLIQEGLEHVINDAEFELEIHSNDEAICRWARETIEEAESIHQKLNIVVATITNLEQKSCEADIVLTPRIKPSEYLPSDP